jgi:hypothetical protein
MSEKAIPSNAIVERLLSAKQARNLRPVARLFLRLGAI